MADDKTRVNRKTAEPPAGPAPAEVSGKIVFHCPNGHRIVVPAKVAGQRGQPPAAGAAVAGAVAEAAAGEGTEPAGTAEERVHAGTGQPTPEGEAEEAVGHAEPPVDMFAGLVESSDSQAAAPEFGDFATQGDSAPFESIEPEQGAVAFQGNPTAALVARLFEEMAHGGIVEVHITGGSVILPEFYEARWSVGSHGLFASRAADGTVTLTAVAWDSIQKIVVRQVEGLPDGMFE
jgi:hypothetical protein